MKHLLLTVIFSFFFLIGKSQNTVYNCRDMSISTWSTYYKNWNESNKYKCNLKITIHKSGISINNEAESFYRLYSSTFKTEEMSDRKVATWDAVDDEEKTCITQIIRFKKTGNMIIQFIYNDLLLQYYVSNPQLLDNKF